MNGGWIMTGHVLPGVDHLYHGDLRADSRGSRGTHGERAIQPQRKGKRFSRPRYLLRQLVFPVIPGRRSCVMGVLGKRCGGCKSSPSQYHEEEALQQCVGRPVGTDAKCMESHCCKGMCAPPRLLYTLL